MKKLIILTAASSLVVMAGCTTSSQQADSGAINYETELAARNQEIDQLRKQLSESPKAAGADMASQSSRQSGSSMNMMGSNSGSDLLPPNAKPGQCFARVYSEPVYQTETESVLKAEGYEVVEVVPAVYGTEKKTVMTNEETEVLEVIPAVYGWKEEQVLVSPEITELRRVPAEYAFVEEKVLVKPAHSIWKKGTGPITKINQSTGEIMCLVEVPAVYETHKKRVLKTPETTRKVIVKDAVYQTVKTRIVKEPAKTITKKIPAVYDTVTVKKLVKEADTKVSEIPPVYETVNKSIKVKDGFVAWEPVLCETNVTSDIIRDLQQRLNEKEYNAGPVDGIYGWQTTQAVRKYQNDNALTGDGQLTITLVDALGLNHNQ